jgi:phosphopantothenoylcysteine decarboxylase/phosphopantothenate--cysteine ligase
MGFGESLIQLPQRINEDKIKMINNQEIVDHVIKYSLNKLENQFKQVLVTTGPTFAPIDDVRGIINIFKGELGLKIARELWINNYQIKLIYGKFGRIQIPSYLDSTPVITFEEYKQCVLDNINNFDIGIFTAAVSDYVPIKQNGKIKSKTDGLCLQLNQTEKVIDLAKKKNPNICIISAKVIDGNTDELQRICKKRICEDGHSLVIGNTLSMTKLKMSSIVSRHSNTIEYLNKTTLAKKLIYSINNM